MASPMFLLIVWTDNLMINGQQSDYTLRDQLVYFARWDRQFVMIVLAANYSLF